MSSWVLLKMQKWNGENGFWGKKKKKKGKATDFEGCEDLQILKIGLTLETSSALMRTNSFLL